MAVAGSPFYFHSALLVSLSLSGTYRVRRSSFNLSQSTPPSPLPFHLAIFIFLPFIIYYPHCFIWYIYLADLSSFRLFQPFHIFALLVRRAFTIHSPYFYGYTGAPRIQLFPFLFYFRRERATDTSPLVKTFSVPLAVISAASSLCNPLSAYAG